MADMKRFAFDVFTLYRQQPDCLAGFGYLFGFGGYHQTSDGHRDGYFRSFVTVFFPASSFRWYATTSPTASVLSCNGDYRVAGYAGRPTLAGICLRIVQTAFRIRRSDYYQLYRDGPRPKHLR